MKIEAIDVNKAVDKVKQLLEQDAHISAGLRAAINVLLLLVRLLCNRLGLTSRNSSKPPSSDVHYPKAQRPAAHKKQGKQKGGQPGHNGTTLEPVAHPDDIKVIKIDRRTLPREGVYSAAGYVSRQVFDIKVTRFVTEYRAEQLVDQAGHRFTARFPTHLTHRAQYGASIKSRAVYLSVEQLIPYERIQAQFKQDAMIDISTGTLVNFKHEAACQLERLEFEKAAKYALSTAEVLHSDETGINIGGQRVWLHGASNASWSWFEAHQKRGREAMEAINILPHFLGVLCHDHWAPYYHYPCRHSLCNAHHIRELRRANEQDHQVWAGDMLKLLSTLNQVTERHNGSLSGSVKRNWKKKYAEIIAKGEKETPLLKRKPGQRGRIKQSRSRNLLDRLNHHANDVLRFIETPQIPFTNNQGERDIRMTKVQQKISGCFVSFETAKKHYLIASYLSTCKKNNISAADAIKCLFDGKLPAFIQKTILHAQDTS